MFTIKICGIRSISDALVVAEAGGNAVGFNFYSRSDRYVDPDTARAIAKKLPATVAKVGVFVNESASAITATCRHVGLDAVQLHGDEPASLLTELSKSLSVVRAVRLGPGGLAAANEGIRACFSAGRMPDGVLVDAQMPGEYGGTGRTVDWQALAAQRPLLGQMPLILAGGLTPQNVREAIETVRPNGVDTASGVEGSPGVKDHGRVREFIREATDALNQRCAEAPA